MSISVALLVICLIIVSYTLGFVSGTSSRWKDETEKHIRGLEATIEKRGKQIETQTREIEVLTADLKSTKDGICTNFEDVNRRLDEVEYTIQAEPDISEITDRLNKMSDILIGLMHVEGSQGEETNTKTEDEMPSYTLLDMVDKKEEKSYDERT